MVFIDLGLKLFNVHPYTYYQGQGANIVLVAVYVDDILIISLDVGKIGNLRRI